VKTFTKLMAFALCIVMLILSAGCGSNFRNAISFGSTVITENMYAYWMGQQKTYYLLMLTGGYTDNPQIWTTDTGSGYTYGDMLTVMAMNDISSKAILHELFTTYGLEITAEDEANIDARVQALTTQAGSVTALNSVLSVYGVNADILRDILLFDAKVAKVQEHLYGENGIEAVSDADVEAFYADNYYRTKYIWISHDFRFVFDDTGEHVIDTETGTYKTKELTDAQAEETRNLVADLQDRIATGDDFDELVQEHTMDTRLKTYTDGLYFTSGTTIVPEEIANTVMEMKIGEVKTIENDEGTFIIKRYELEDKKYEDEEYVNMIGDIKTNLNAQKMSEMLNSYTGSLVMNNAVIQEYPIGSVRVNTYF